MTQTGNTLEVKSRFGAEFRRFSIAKLDFATGSGKESQDRNGGQSTSSNSLDSFSKFYLLLETLHQLGDQQFLIFYTAREDDVLPINNVDNLAHAVASVHGLLRLQVFRKEEYTGYLSDLPLPRRPKSRFSQPQQQQAPPPPPNRRITMLDDFRKVSSIIDVDIVPESYRRVKLMRNSAKPLGFYIRDGTSIRVTPNGIEKVPAIFISRLLQGGLAESTGLLAVNDEVIEVNGIEVTGKTLDQVTDMMVANSSNLILTTKPVNQSTCLQSNRRSRASQLSHDSVTSAGGGGGGDSRNYYSDGGGSGGSGGGGGGGGSNLGGSQRQHQHQHYQTNSSSSAGGRHGHTGSLPVATGVGGPLGAPGDTL